MSDEVRARKWFARLKRVMREMPSDVEIAVSGFGCIAMLERGTVDANANNERGMDQIYDDEIDSFQSRNVIGENSTI